MRDFLLFKSFVSIDALILFYYMGAIVLPFFAWYLLRFLLGKFSFFKEQFEMGKKILFTLLPLKQKVFIILLFTCCFLFMELLWRMMFEFLIAFMQMRDALVLG